MDDLKQPVNAQPQVCVYPSFLMDGRVMFGVFPGHCSNASWRQQERQKLPNWS